MWLEFLLSSPITIVEVVTIENVIRSPKYPSTSLRTTATTVFRQKIEMMLSLRVHTVK